MSDDSARIRVTYDLIVMAADDTLLFEKIVLQLTKSPVIELPETEMTYHQGDLGLLYQTRYQFTGNKGDIAPAIEHFKAAIEALPTGHPYRPGYLYSLAQCYSYQYQHLGDSDVLEDYLEYSKSSVNATPVGDPELPARLHGLATAFRDHYLRYGHLSVHNFAIGCNTAAVEMTSWDDPELSSRLQSLGAVYLDRFQRLGKVDDLRSSLYYNTLALENTPSHDSELSMRQQALAVSYKELYWNLGNINDLESALKHEEAALESVAEKNLSLLRQNIAVTYGTRYQRLGDLNDLELAIKYGQEAFQATPKENESFSHCCQNLAIFHKDRYSKFEEIKDLEAALKYNDLALKATPIEHPVLSSRLTNQAVCYADSYEKRRNINDLETAIKLCHQAIRITPPDHLNAAMPQHTLGFLYFKQYQKLGKLDDIKLSLEHNHNALKMILPTHSSMNYYKRDLGMAYFTLFGESKDVSDLYCALFYTSAASISKTASPASLWRAASMWADQAHQYHLPECLEAYSTALSQLPDLMWIGSSLNVRHDILAQLDMSSFTASAVEAALDFKKVQLAVEFFEQGLAISYRQMLQLQDEPHELHRSFPEIANKLKDISLQLQQHEVHLETGLHTVQKSQELQHSHHSLASERNQVIKQIRQLPGFNDFFLPLPFYKISAAATEGPVIMLSCSKKRSDAIIILPSSEPLHVSLPLVVTLQSANVQLDKLKLALEMYNIHSREVDMSRAGRVYGKALIDGQKLFEDILLWLWENIVHILFNILHKHGVSEGRLWWCPSGPFTYLPLHAAALQSPFIQSYTSTLSSLIHARSKFQTSTGTEETLASFSAVGVSKIPNQPYMELPMVAKELSAISKIVKKYPVNFLMDNQATVQNAFKYIKEAQWIHVACHGQQNHHDPLQSGLVLHDGMLKLEQILGTNLPLAKFIFLSACQTAMGDAKLVNESMHLSGGFIAAGFQGSIGTLWNMADSDGPKVAEIVYQQLFGDSQSPDITKAAEALHNAVQILKQQGAPFHRWIPFVHMGI